MDWVLLQKKIHIFPVATSIFGPIENETRTERVFRAAVWPFY